MTLEQFQNGEVCYKLNQGSASEGEANGSQDIINWYQNIGEDAFPVLDPTHQIVTFDDGKYGNPDGIADIMADSRQQSTGIFNLAGQRMTRMQKGINIVNGRKIIVK